MLSRSACLSLAALALLAILLIVAYEKKWLNKFLPTNWRKQGFVGAYGRTPEMQNCLAFSKDDGKWPYFNRCTWV
jgi:hypothetical protein